MRMLIADPDASDLATMQTGLNFYREDWEIDTTTTAEAALQQYRQNAPDLLILDLQLPMRGGLELLREIRLQSDVPVILLGRRADDQTLVSALGFGADRYLVKPVSLTLLYAHLRALLRRNELNSCERPLPDLVVGDVALFLNDYSVTVGDQSIHLTPIEYKLLHLLVRNAGRLVPDRQLLRWCWGPEYETTAGYLKVFVSRIRRKIESDPTAPRHILNERGRGYRFVAPSSARRFAAQAVSAAA